MLLFQKYSKPYTQCIFWKFLHFRLKFNDCVLLKDCLCLLVGTYWWTSKLFLCWTLHWVKSIKKVENNFLLINCSYHDLSRSHSRQKIQLALVCHWHTSLFLKYCIALNCNQSGQFEHSRLWRNLSIHTSCLWLFLWCSDLALCLGVQNWDWGLT